jgi:hypothetical protein
MRITQTEVEVTLVVVTAVYVVITSRLVHAASQDRADRLERDRSEQARNIGGYIESLGDNGGMTTICMYVVNASPLPIGAVKGRLRRMGSGDAVGDFSEVVVLQGGQKEANRRPTAQRMLASNLATNLLLWLEFDDDDGQKWRKYESDDVPLRRLDRAGEPVPAQAGRHWWHRWWVRSA